jgi:hypothetical protein
MFQIKAVEKIKTHFVLSKFFSENHVIYEIMSKNMVEPERPQTIWRPRLEYWIIKATLAQAHARVCAPILTRPHTHTHTHTHTNMDY